MFVGLLNDRAPEDLVFGDTRFAGITAVERPQDRIGGLVQAFPRVAALPSASSESSEKRQQRGSGRHSNTCRRADLGVDQLVEFSLPTAER